LLFGLVVGELLGDVDRDRVRRTVRRFRPMDDEESTDGDELLEHALLDVFKGNPATRELDLNASALGGGLVELTGTAPDETTRELAAELARGVIGAEVVVNRILVDGVDTNGQSAVVS
jgi:osmotically-inducible protein OsmY